MVLEALDVGAAAIGREEPQLGIAIGQVSLLNEGKPTVVRAPGEARGRHRRRRQLKPAGAVSILDNDGAGPARVSQPVVSAAQTA